MFTTNQSFIPTPGFNGGFNPFPFNQVPTGFNAGGFNGFPTFNQGFNQFQNPFMRQGGFNTPFFGQQTPFFGQGWNGFGFNTPQSGFGGQTPWGFNTGFGWGQNSFQTPQNFWNGGFIPQPWNGFQAPVNTPFAGQQGWNWNIPTPIFGMNPFQAQGGVETNGQTNTTPQNGQQPGFFGGFSPIAFVYPNGFVAPTQQPQNGNIPQRDAA